MDFIFGTYTTDELKLIHHRMSRMGVQHANQIYPLDPLPNEPITLTVQIGVNTSADNVAVYYTTNGSLPEGSRGVAKNGNVVHFRQVETVWDILNWGYVSVWQAEIPAQAENTIVRYQISAWSEGQAEIFGDWPDVDKTAEHATVAFFRNEALPTSPQGDPSQGKIFQFHVDRFTPPDWGEKAIIYQVFVDRFYPGKGKSWNKVNSLMDFYGGTLWGVRDKLDYIAELGANCIWLSPTWESPTHHGYDVVDYKKVESRLGGDEALHAVIEGAHERGLRVLLDMPCNHISNQYPIFQEALTNTNSPYRDWFYFDDSAVGYRGFFGTAFMPELNLASPDARAWMLEIARYWIREFQIDGYRLDVANGPGANFWNDFLVACKQEKADIFCFGEIIDSPHVFLQYVGKLDGCLDFHLGASLRKTYAYKTWSEADFARFLERHQSYFPKNFILPSFIDNHDMDRFLYAAQGDKAALKQAAAVQMRLPNPPIIYYGTEVALTQKMSARQGQEASREPMIWGDEQDKDMLAYYKRLIKARHG